ncbi:MAG: GPR endopeptidase, partial [Oscillospiraceae bacterium]|nr:GPR endopeptidase [Oscillospiraceae bacterium]
KIYPSHSIKSLRNILAYNLKKCNSIFSTNFGENNSTKYTKDTKMNRTDLAIESPIKGLQQKERGKYFKINEIIIDTDEYIQTLGKGKGRYITLETEDFSRFTEHYNEKINELSEEIKEFIPKKGLVSVIGLGNNDITPDSLGVKTADKILATRHLTEKYGDIFTDLRPVSVFTTGVLAQTGIETAETAKAICEKLQPSTVIVLDALACSDISRLGKTIQIADAGIAPGSGVKNSRKQLNTQTLGFPVIAIGVPTVVDIHTIIKGITSEKTYIDNMLVTPKDIDKLIDNASDILAKAINSALHPEMTLKELNSLIC